MAPLVNFVAVLAFFLASCACSFSQSLSETGGRGQSSVVSTSTVKRIDQPQYLVQPFDISVSKLEPNFAGHDIIAILNSIARSQAPVSTSPANNHLAFVLPYWHWARFSHYDARKQLLKVKLATERLKFPGQAEEMDTLPIKFLNNRSENYFAYNSYGDRPLVQRYNSTQYELSFDANNWLFPSGGSKYRESTFLIPVSRDEAITFKQGYPFLVLVCALKEPHQQHLTKNDAKENYGGGRVTVDYRNVVEREFLHVIPEQLWVVDRITGEVLKKFSESSTLSGSDRQKGDAMITASRSFSQRSLR